MIGATQRSDGWWSVYFEFEYNGMSYKDAIVLSPIDYINITESELAEIKNSRFAAWVAAIQPPDVSTDNSFEIVDNSQGTTIDVTPVIQTELRDFLYNN